MSMVDVGFVRAINRFPVKSMRGEPMQAATLKWTGLDGDRQYAFFRARDRSRFPWLTGRNIAELVLHAARYDDPTNTRGSPVRVTAPDGTEYDLGSPELAARLTEAVGEEVRLLQVGRGTFDSMPVSCMSTATEATLDEAFGNRLGVGRYRSNIVIESHMREDDWLDGVLAFGNGNSPPRLRVVCKIERCAMITIDPQSGQKDLSVLRMVGNSFDNQVGAYCSAEALGTIAVGDRVFLQRDR